MKIASMASSSNRRSSSSKKNGAGNARVISVKRADMLPRKGVASVASAGLRKSIAEPSLDSPTEPAATEAAGSKKRAQRQVQAETAGSRTKAHRAGGRAASKLKKPAAKKVGPMAPAAVPETAEVATPALVFEKRPDGGAEPATTAEASAIDALAGVESEVVVEPSAIVEETTIATPVAPVLHPARRALARTVPRLLSILRRWTGARL
jgi:hypothetical protein